MATAQMIPSYNTLLFTDIYDNVTDFLTDYNGIGLPTTISTNNATTLFYLLYARYGNSPIANRDTTQFKYKLFSVIWQYGPTWEKRLSIQETLRGLSLNDLIDDGQLHELFEHAGSNTNSSTSTGTASRDVTENGTNTGTVTNAGTTSSTVDHDASTTTDNATEEIKNHAYNPSTTPAANAYSPLGYINDQNAIKNDFDGSVVLDEATESSGSSNNTQTNNLATSNTTGIEDENSNSTTASGTNTYDDELTRSMTKGKLAAYEKLIELLDTDVTQEFLSKFRTLFKQFVLPEKRLVFVTEEDEDDE